MALPANSQIEVRGSMLQLETNGGSITSGSIVQANDSTYDTETNGEGCPDAEFALSWTQSTAPTEGTSLSLYARPLNVISTGDTEVPEATRPTRFICSFIVNNVTSLQYDVRVARNLPKLAEYYLHNNGTGQTVATGWVLEVTPLTVGASV